MILPLLFLLLPDLVLHAATPCVRVSGAMVTAGELRLAVPGLSRLEPGQPLFPSPAIGLVRRVVASDLRRYLDEAVAVPANTCVERISWQPTADDMKSAIIAILPVLPRRLELVEVSRYAVPKGRLEFSLEGISSYSPSRTNDVLLWNGRVIPDSGPAVRIWARVRIEIVGTVFRLARGIASGDAISPENLIPDSAPVSWRELKEPLVATALSGCVAVRPRAVGDRLTKSDIRCVAGSDVRPVEAVVRVGNVVIKVPGMLHGSVENPAEYRFQAKGMKKAVPARTNSGGVVEVVVP
ncbi:MAG: hypothetical protein JNK87_41960 [Bryobacterales bacterium]|nr:hypothetical protein [Bryobacterales bacterium]